MNTMSIHINFGNLQSSDAIVAWTRRRVRASLRRLASRITRVEVHLADINGPKEGKADLRCAMEARINGRKPLAVEQRAANLYTAIDGAARRLRTAASRAVDRVRSRSHRSARARTRGSAASAVRATPSPEATRSAPWSPALDGYQRAEGTGALQGVPTGNGGERPGRDSRRHVIIAGFGPVGRAVGEALAEHGVPVTIIDSSARTARTQATLGRRIVHGDATDPEILASAGICDAMAFAVTIPDGAVALRACRAARALAPDLFIAARTRHLSDALLARQAGADAVTVEEMVAAQAMSASLGGVLGPGVCQTCEGAD